MHTGCEAPDKGRPHFHKQSLCVSMLQRGFNCQFYAQLQPQQSPSCRMRTCMHITGRKYTDSAHLKSWQKQTVKWIQARICAEIGLWSAERSSAQCFHMTAQASNSLTAGRTRGAMDGMSGKGTREVPHKLDWLLGVWVKPTQGWRPQSDH